MGTGYGDSPTCYYDTSQCTNCCSSCSPSPLETYLKENYEDDEND